MNTEPHKLLTCPYNPAHQVEQYRMHIHLDKCRKQYKGSKKVECPFDSLHVVSEAELDYHVSVCNKRANFDAQRYVVDDVPPPPSLAPPPAPAPAFGIDHLLGEENWDDEPHASYTPGPKESHIIRKVKGATPSERRQARMEGVRNYKPPPPLA